MKVITYDFETFYSQHDYTLSKMGPIEYIRDPRFDAFMVSMAFDGKRPDVWCNTTDAGAVSKALHYHIDPQEDILVGHNSTGFDALILSERFNIHPRNMWDTIWMMRWVGLSSIIREQHAALTEKLGNGIKQAGTVVSNGKHWPQDFTESEQIFFKQYCLDDTAQCQANMLAMLPYVTDDCLRFMSLTARMATEPVFELDAALLEEYIKQLDAEAENARQKIMELFHFHSLPDFFKAIRSKEKFAGMLRALGVEPPTKVSEKKTATAIAKVAAQLAALQGCGEVPGDSIELLQNQLVELKEKGVRDYAFSKQDIDFLALAEHEDPRVRLLVETRLEFNSSVMRSRAETLLKFARYGKPLPIMLSAFKAHTSRYTAGIDEGKSDATQLQNLPKRNPAYLPLRKAVRAPRGMKVVAADSAQIECRCLSWEAQQLDLLGHFREGRDPYAEFGVYLDNRFTAQEIHDGAKAGDKTLKKIRNLSKTFILSAGYSVGARRAASAIWVQGIHLAESYEKHAELTKDYLYIYRSVHDNITNFWKVCQHVIEALAVGASGCFGGPNGDLFHYGTMPICDRDDWAVPSVMLPSGYALRYPNLRVVEGKDKIEFVYDQQRGKNTISTRIYSGLLTAHCTQSLAFQIMMWQACRMDEDGIHLAANVHDCWATVVPESQAEPTLERMVYWMKQLPSWAQGLPIDAEGEISNDFTIV